MSIFDLANQSQSPSMGGTGGIGALAGDSIYPLSRMDKTQYATPLQLPTSAEVISSDYDPKTDAFTGMPQQRFAKGGDVEGDVDVSFGYPNTAYMDPAYGFAHDPVHNAMMKARSEGILERYQSGKKGELSPEEEEVLKIRAMVMAGNPKYDPRYMPLRLDDRPLSPIQAAMMRLQADKQIGEGNARAGISALAAALPNRQGVTAIPGAYDVGYNTPVGPGNLDVSAFRAMRGMPDGKVPYGVNARYSIPFAEGGITSIPRFDGEDGSQVETPSWNPESGQVKLQQYEDPKDPFSPVKELVDYSIPKGQIQTFIPNTDPTTGTSVAGGQLILKDGSTLGVDGSGVVHAATPGRNDYTLNKEGYYQPTGENLIWRGDANMLTKKIGGVEVQVPGLYHKGGYQDPKGNLRVDENGVPVALAPNYLDSGVGKSGLSDAAPYIAAAAMMAATGMPTGFEGMVLPSETLLGSMGYLGAGSTAGISSADLGTTSYIAPQSSAFPGVSTADLGTSSYIAPSSSAPSSVSPTITEATTNAARIHDLSTPYSGPLNYAGDTLKTTGMSTGDKLLAASLASKALSGGDSGGGGTYAPSSTTTTTQAPQQPSIASTTYNPAFTMPNMFSMNQVAPGTFYQPQTFNYNTRYAAQGGMMHASGGVADLGGYAAGGKLLKGPGDGMSDDIVANIAGKQPARLADGEFVVPADVVSHLGNGSTDAGAKHLYKMMDRIRQARTGNPKQGKRINPDKFLPKG